METRMLVAGLAMLCGFAAAYAAAYLVAAALRKRNVAMAAQGDARSVSGVIAWRVRNGYATLLPLSRLLRRNHAVRGFSDELASMLSRRAMMATGETALSVLVAVLFAVALVAGAVTRSPIAAIACPVCVACVLFILTGGARDRRLEEVREAVPDALDSMASCFSSGFTLLQTFQQVASDTPGPLGATFAQSAHVLEMGGSAERALEGLREGAHASELAFVAVALDVQHQSGGAMRQVLDAAADTVKGELALRRSLRVQTAQAKLSARVVVIMPFILVAAFSLASPDFLMPFFSSPFGYALLAAAIIMQVAGVVLVRRALAVEGVS